MIPINEIITYLENLKASKQADVDECMSLKCYDSARRLRNDIILLDEILNEIL